MPVSSFATSQFFLRLSDFITDFRPPPPAVEPFETNSCDQARKGRVGSSALLLDKSEMHDFFFERRGIQDYKFKPSGRKEDFRREVLYFAG